MDIGTLADRVYQVLRERILNGAYAPGQKLNLAQLARDLQVSNTPVREAMARLERVGLVETVPYCGPKVKRLSPAQVADLFDVRIALEELAVRLVAQSQAPDALQGMAEALAAHERVCREGDLEGTIDADRAFHDALVQASGNSVLIEMLPTLSDRTRLLIELNAPRQQAMDPGAALRGLQGHQRILESLRDRNPEAAALALRRELTGGKEHLLKRMSDRQPGVDLAPSLKGEESIP
jgi:DNA-binding GntR family transcriptional regulator